MSIFSCSSCTQPIPAQNPRFHCQICPNYDACANCNALGRTAGSHSMQHRAVLFRASGTGAGGTTSRFGNTQGVVNYQASGPMFQHVDGPPSYQASGPPPYDAKGYSQNQTYASQSVSAGWTPLYNHDHSPAPCFVTMMQQFFACLDPGRTGYVTPEAYSSFLEAQGYPFHQNIWRFAHANAFGNRESTADATLKNAYDMFAIEHTLVQRYVQPQAQAQVGSGFRASISGLLSGNSFGSTLSGSGPASPMPLLTLRGLTASTALDVLVDLPLGWQHLNRALRYYQLPIWREKGDIPREMLPAVTPPAVQERARGALWQAENQLASAKMAADIQRRGGEIAVSAIGGGQWVYRS